MNGFLIFSKISVTLCFLVATENLFSPFEDYNITVKEIFLIKVLCIYKGSDESNLVSDEGCKPRLADEMATFKLSLLEKDMSRCGITRVVNQLTVSDVKETK